MKFIWVAITQSIGSRGGGRFFQRNFIPNPGEDNSRLRERRRTPGWGALMSKNIAATRFGSFLFLFFRSSQLMDLR